MVRVLKRLPPNYLAIVKALPAVKRHPNAVFTYYPNVYYPAPGKLSYDVEQHEEVHIKQQQAMGVEAWWELYLKEPGFRLSQELEAYRVQYKACDIYNRGQRRVILNQIAADLSSAMYGKMLTKAEALEEIVNA